MSNLMSGEPGGMGTVLVEGQVQPCLSWLRQAGELVVGTGCLKSGSTTLSLHTDFGPAGAGQGNEPRLRPGLAW